MKYLTLFMISLVLFLSCKNEDKTSINGAIFKKEKFSIVIHGGAGTILKENMTPEKETAYRETLKRAILLGHGILKNGGSSLDAVQNTIKVLEDSPLFNAGKGAVFTHSGTNEHDASIIRRKRHLARFGTQKRTRPDNH